jgi:hypothetical protein
LLQETPPYNPMAHPSPSQKHDFEFNKQAQKVNKLIMQWQSGADSAPAGNYNDY